MKEERCSDADVTDTVCVFICVCLCVCMRVHVNFPPNLPLSLHLCSTFPARALWAELLGVTISCLILL